YSPSTPSAVPQTPRCRSAAAECLPSAATIPYWQCSNTAPSHPLTCTRAAPPGSPDPAANTPLQPSISPATPLPSAPNGEELWQLSAPAPPLAISNNAPAGLPARSAARSLIAAAHTPMPLPQVYAIPAPQTAAPGSSPAPHERS